jgi:indole-3-glycerol phosphate synthase
MNSILREIYENKKATVERLKKECPIERLQQRSARMAPLRDFRTAIARKGRINVIAEIKKASPSAGVIRGRIDPGRQAESYAEAGAAAISVLTEEKYFQGDAAYLLAARNSAPVPILRKDFIFDPYQVRESLVLGADAILLIAAMLEKSRLQDLVALAGEIGLDCLLEVHDEEDLAKALATRAEIIGINNRNLNDFSVDLNNAAALIPLVPKGKIIVVESGIREVADIRRFNALGVRAFLVGETLMRSADIRKTMQEIKGAING